MDRVRWGFNTRVVSCGLVSILYRFIIITVVERVPNPAREPSPYLLCAPTGRRVLGAWVCRQCAYTVTARGCSAIFGCGVLGGCVRCGYRCCVCLPRLSRSMLFLRRIRPHIRSFPDCA